MYAVAGIYVLAFFFNAQQEALGPAGAGLTQAWSTLNVLSVAPGSPTHEAGLRPGDVLEAVNGQTLRGIADWFLARAHFERDRPITLQIRRIDQHLQLRFVISAPAWRAWNREHALAVIAYYFARFVLLFLALVIAFNCPQQLSARFAALMFAIGAVSEGYPSSGWAASLSHLPALLSIPIYLAVSSCLLSPLVLLCFVTSFPHPQRWTRWQLAVLLIPAAILAISIVRSGIAMIYTPALLARSWPLVLSVAPLRALPTTAGVTPLLFINLFPLLYSTFVSTALLGLWLAFSILCFAAAFFLVLAKHLQDHNQDEKRQVRVLSTGLLIFSALIAHNFLARNWMAWFGASPPTLFSASSFVVEDLLFLFVPFTVLFCVLREDSKRKVTAQQR
jgi:hypothetical protein